VVMIGNLMLKTFKYKEIKVQKVFQKQRIC